jgi:topoisomerase-4 subunit A
MAKVQSLDDMPSKKVKKGIKIKKKKKLSPAVDTSNYVPIEGHIQDIEITEYTKKALKEYGTYVVSDRAVPDYRDGLKPSHRAILWSAFELGLHPNAAVKKAARTVGDAIGKYHPHGDTAAYGAMVTIANTAIPAIHGQGNWGGPLAPAAAQRYTEAKLSKFSSLFLLDRNYLSVTPMIPNYSEDLVIPLHLPALLPTILLFGNPTAPAYGVRAGNPTFSFKSVVKVVLDMLKGKTYTDSKLAKTLEVRYDYNCHVVTPESVYEEMIETGKGNVVTRPVLEASWEEKRIYIKSFAPGGTSGSFDSIKSVAKQLQRITDLPGISSACPENSKRNKNAGTMGVLYIITPSRGIQEDAFWELAEKIETMLTFKANYALGITVRKEDRNNTGFYFVGYLNLLEQWVKYRVAMESRLISKLIADADSALEIQEGYARVCTTDADLQKCIKIIRTAEDSEVKPKLMKAFKLNERQVDAVLDLRLRRLGKMAISEVRAAISELEARIAELQKEAKAPALRAAKDLQERVAKYIKNPDEKLLPHMIAD